MIERERTLFYVIRTSPEGQRCDDEKILPLFDGLNEEVEEEEDEGGYHENQPQALQGLHGVVPVCKNEAKIESVSNLYSTGWV